MYKKLIFLDIDGCINSYDYFISPEYKELTRDLTTAQMIALNHRYHIDPKAIKLINLLVDKSGAEVVLSSSWRELYPLDKMNELLTDRGATFKLIDKTPTISFSFVPRGQEIRAYLEDLKVQPEAFVILDDIDAFPTYKKNLILTNDQVGITMQDVRRALKILNGK